MSLSRSSADFGREGILHFDGLAQDRADALFHRAPERVAFDAGARTLGEALGAVLYVPGARENLLADILKQRARGVQCVVIDIEDSVPDAALDAVARRVARDLGGFAQAGAARLPLVFVRLSDAPAIDRFLQALEPAGAAFVAGFALPKVSSASIDAVFTVLRAGEQRFGRRFLAMPILETALIARAETRLAELLRLRDAFDREADRIAAIRIGATDLAGVFGLRRDGERTIYSISAVAAAIGDIVSVFGAGDRAYPVSGPVWEHFPQRERVQKPLLRETPFAEHGVPALRQQLLVTAQDALIAEVELDRANGLSGKTVVHPSHVPVVHALTAVSHEEYLDACDIAAAAGGGVIRSAYANKMNEVSPHRGWAARTLRRATAYGVLAEGVSYIDLFAELRQGA